MQKYSIDSDDGSSQIWPNVTTLTDGCLLRSKCGPSKMPTICRRPAQRRQPSSRLPTWRLIKQGQSRLFTPFLKISETLEPEAWSGHVLIGSRQIEGSFAGSDALYNDPELFVTKENRYLFLLPHHPLLRPRLFSFQFQHQYYIQIKKKMNEAMQTWVLEQIASILGTSPADVPLDGKFTELGGDSLSAVRLAQVCRARNVTLPVVSILGSPSIASMLLCMSPLEAVTSTPTPELIDDDSSSSSMADIVTPNTCRSFDSVVELSNSTELAGGSAMTEIQLALIHGSQKNPSRNIISYFETYPWTSLPAIREAWQTIVQIEPIFRTKFDLRNEGRLIEQKRAAFIWNELDVFSKDAYEAALRSSASIFQPEDGASCDLMVGNRFDIITFHDSKSGSAMSTIIWRIHHALIDGYSAMLVLQKVRRAVVCLPVEPSPSFAALAQNLLRMQEEFAAEGEAFWRRQYAHYPSAAGDLALAPPSIGEKDDLDTVSFQVQIPELNPFVRSSGVTFATLCYSAWALTMSLYTNSDTIVFGAVLSGRNLPLPGVERVVGPLMNTLPMHVTVDRSLSLSDFVRSVFGSLMALTSFQWTLPKHGYSRQFSSAISMQFDLQVDANINPVSGSNSNFVAPLNKPYSETRTDIPISIFIDTDGIVRLQYDAALFNRHDMEILCQHYEATFSSMLRPDTLVGECLDRVVDLKARPLLRGMGNCHSPQTSFSSAQEDLVMLFDSTVAANPEAIAVEKGDEKITYGALDIAARKVASALKMVTKQEDIVFLHADRSINWIIGIWGILKAGAVYCPVDPGLPQAIRDTNYQSAEAKIFLGCVGADKRFIPTLCDKFLAVGDMLGYPELDETALPSRHWAVDPQANAYVCFTSGSTGNPKGVMCTHAGLVAFERDQDVRLMAQPGWRVAQTMSVAFDGSIHEIFSALTYGATLVLAHSADPFAHLTDVDTTILTPSAAKVLEPDHFPNLKTVSSLTTSSTQCRVMEKF